MTDLPLWWASAGTVVIFLLLLVLNWKINPSGYMTDAPDQARWRDLRVWATALIMAQLMIYFIFQ